MLVVQCHKLSQLHLQKSMNGKPILKTNGKTISRTMSRLLDFVTMGFVLFRKTSSIQDSHTRDSEVSFPKEGRQLHRTTKRTISEIKMT